WITAVVGLLADPARQERLAAAGRAFVEQHHSWSSQLAGLQPLLQAPLSEMPLRQAPHPPPTLFQAVSAGQRSATAEQVCSPPSRWAGGGGTP
ncbi:MAG: hypothetical protein KDA45_03680, partial [Planctomycetales bacterium]|nr:hypothetical protein [Planctomycetales bacterium]